MYSMAFVVGMVGLTYASVPLYRAFCAATGVGGTTRRATIEDVISARSSQQNPELEEKLKKRHIRISFNSVVADDLPWTFKPTQEAIVITPGQSALAFFTCKNNSTKAVTGVSIYNVTPAKVGKYFYKIQCFCFEEQKLRPGEQVDMPVFFYLDPDFVNDRNMANVREIMLSYMFYHVDESDDQLMQQIQKQKEEMQAQILHA